MVSYACDHLPIGDYYIKELTTYPGYILNLDEFDFRFYPNQDDVKKLHIVAVSASTEEKPILNRPDGTPGASRSTESARTAGTRKNRINQARQIHRSLLQKGIWN